MHKRPLDLYINDLVSSVENILNYTSDLTFEFFFNDQKTIDAVLRNFEIMGESAKNISDELKSNYSNIPWKNIAGMRDKLIHAYFGIDLELI